MAIKQNFYRDLKMLAIIPNYFILGYK